MAKRTVSAKSKPSTKHPSPKSRKSTPRNGAAAKPAKADDATLTIDRRRADRREEAAAPKPEVKLERRQKVQRRRQIDPTTCERDYSVQEVEFMNAMDEYKRKSGRMFPTCSEVLEVIRNLGYVQLSPGELAAQPVAQPQTPVAADDDADDEELF
jgi:hypothetical protein